MKNKICKSWCDLNKKFNFDQVPGEHDIVSGIQYEKGDTKGVHRRGTLDRRRETSCRRRRHLASSKVALIFLLRHVLFNVRAPLSPFLLPDTDMCQSSLYFKWIVYVTEINSYLSKVSLFSSSKYKLQSFLQ